MTLFQNPTIYIGTLRVDEPITVLTDFMFVGMCIYAYFNIKPCPANKMVGCFRLFFLLMGLSTFVAAVIGHAFLYHFGFEAKIYGWVGGIIGSSFSQLGSTFHVRKHIGEIRFKNLMRLNVIEIIIAFISLFVFWSFVVVEIHMAFGLVAVVTSLEFIHYKRTQSQTSKYLMIGVALAVLAVLCHILKLAISKWFNHMDLSHVITVFSIYFMYKGVKLYPGIEKIQEKIKSLILSNEYI